MSAISKSCLAVAGLLVSTMVVPAGATLIKELNFNVDGVLPSAEPDIVLKNNSGLPEASLYSVSDGLLHQRTFSVDGNISYHWPSVNGNDGTFDPSWTTILEARLKVIQVNATDASGSYFQAFDGSGFRYTVSFRPDGANVFTDSGNVAVFSDIFDFHTYRMESPGGSNQVKLFVDDELRFSGTASSVSAANVNQFSFGDGRTLPGNGADTDWDWIRVWQVPVSPTVVVLGNSGWQVSWDSSLDPFVDIAVDAVTENAVFIERTAEFIQGKGPAGFPTIPITFTQIEADAVEQIVINDEVITNSTDSNWTGFRYQLLDGNDVAFNPDMSNASAGGNGFSTSPLDNQMFDLDNQTFSVDGLSLGSGGGSTVIADGTQWFPGNGARDGELYIDVVTGDGSLEDPFTVFTLKETPSFVPEPTTVSLLVLGALILLTSSIHGVRSPMVSRCSLSHAATNLEVSLATKTG